MIKGNVLYICLAIYMAGYLVQIKFPEPGRFMRWIGAGLFTLVVVLRLLGVEVG